MLEKWLGDFWGPTFFIAWLIVSPHLMYAALVLYQKKTGQARANAPLTTFLLPVFSPKLLFIKLKPDMGLCFVVLFVNNWLVNMLFALVLVLYLDDKFFGSLGCTALHVCYLL